MSSGKNNLDPRTEKFKKLVTPWEYWDDTKRSRGFQLFDISKIGSADILKMLQTPIDLRTEKIRSWWMRRNHASQVRDQSYDADRHEALGGDLSAGHAVLGVGGSVLYRGKPWISKINSNNTLELPTHFEEGWIMEAIDVSDCSIHFEGLFNIQKLNNVHSFAAKNCSYFDNWCLDHICSELLALKKLDLSGCTLLTPGGLSALIRLPNIESLNLSNIPAFQTKEGALACLLLNDYFPQLEVLGVVGAIDPSSDDTVNIDGELSKTSV